MIVSLKFGFLEVIFMNNVMVWCSGKITNFLALDKMANLLAFPWPPFPHPLIGENPIGEPPVVVYKKAKGNWENVEKVREIDFLKLLLLLYHKV